MTALHIISARYTGDEFGTRYRVLCDGEVYGGLNRWLLAALEDGMSPDDLQLEPDADEPDEWWPGSPDEDSTLAFASRRGWR